MTEYELFEDKEGFDIKDGKADVLIMCCQCGLVHHYFFEIEEDQLRIKPKRCNLRTYWARKKRLGELLNGEDEKWMMIRR